MTDLAEFRSDLAGSKPPNEAALENVRVAALGKKGSISALLATLGKMSPEERKTRAPGSTRSRTRSPRALAGRRSVLKEAALAARLAAERLDVTLPTRRHGAGDRTDPSISQVMDELTAIFSDMGFSIAEGPDIESDDLQFHQAEFPARPSGARNAGHLLLRRQGGRDAQIAAHPYVAGAGAHHVEEPPRRSGSSARGASIAPISTRPIRRCSIRSRVW